MCIRVGARGNRELACHLTMAGSVGRVPVLLCIRNVLTCLGGSEPAGLMLERALLTRGRRALQLPGPPVSQGGHVSYVH